MKQKIEWGIDWSQSSTIQGVIRLIGYGLAFYLVAKGNDEGALTVMTITGLANGGVGVGIKKG